MSQDSFRQSTSAHALMNCGFCMDKVSPWISGATHTLPTGPWTHCCLEHWTAYLKHFFSASGCWQTFAAKLGPVIPQTFSSSFASVPRVTSVDRWSIASPSVAAPGRRNASCHGGTPVLSGSMERSWKAICLAFSWAQLTSWPWWMLKLKHHLVPFARIAGSPLPAISSKRVLDVLVQSIKDVSSQAWVKLLLSSLSEFWNEWRQILLKDLQANQMPLESTKNCKHLPAGLSLIINH